MVRRKGVCEAADRGARRARRLAWAPALAALLVLPAVAHGATLSGHVTRVVDGDTIKVRSRGFEDTVRLIGIDTPETRDPSEPVQCFGLEASARARRFGPSTAPAPPGSGSGARRASARGIAGSRPRATAATRTTPGRASR